MEIIWGILIFITCIILVILSRSITTFVHEMGHAIPALSFTKETVSIYLGSYDNISKSRKFSLGRLVIFFKLNIISWINGMCSHQRPKSKIQELFIIIGGPFASLIFGSVLIYITINFNLNDVQKSILLLFICLAIFDFFTNIIPIQKAIYLYDGSVMYNDGKQLMLLLKNKNLPKSYDKACEHFRNNEFQEAKNLLEKLIDDGYINDTANSKLIDTYINLGEYDKAIDNMSNYSSLDKMKTEDNAKLGFIFYALEAHEKALNYYDNAIHFDYKNAFYLNGRGLVKEALEDYNGAVVDFNAASNINEGYADPIVNMGRIYYNMDEKKTAKSYLESAILLDPRNANAHFFLGKYYDDKHETQLAYNHFLEAEKFGCTDHGLDFYLANLKSDLINKS